jgi:hypothetical protein
MCTRAFWSSFRVRIFQGRLIERSSATPPLNIGLPAGGVAIPQHILTKFDQKLGKAVSAGRTALQR